MATNRIKIQSDISDKYQELINKIYNTNDYDFVAIALQEDVSPHYTKWCYTVGNTNQKFRNIVLRRGFGIAGLVLKTGKPFLNNHLDDFVYSNTMYTPIAKVEALKSAVAVPLIDKDSMLTNGVLLVGYRSSKHFESSDIEKINQYLK